MRGSVLIGVLGACLACAIAAGQSMLVDFGPASFFSGPAITTSPDANGNAWNNFTPGQSIRLVDATGGVSASGSPQGVLLSATTSLGASLFDNEGLVNPDPAALGMLAIGSATRDFVFRLSNSGTTIGLRLGDLDPGLTYGLRLFASVAGGPAGAQTTYTAAGGNGSQSASLATSQNTDTVALIGGIAPTAAGTIDLTLSAAEGSFMHLNAMELFVADAPPVVSIVQQPVAAIADVGGALVFAVQASSNEPGLAIRWERDGVPLADGGRVSGATTGTLTITRAKIGDAGLYRAVARNGATEVASVAVVGSVRTPSFGSVDTDGDGDADFFDLLGYLEAYDGAGP